MNDGLILFGWFSFRVVVFCMRAHCHTKYVYMHISMLCWSYSGYDVFMGHEKRGSSYCCTHDHNSIQVSEGQVCFLSALTELTQQLIMSIVWFLAVWTLLQLTLHRNMPKCYNIPVSIRFLQLAYPGFSKHNLRTNWLSSGDGLASGGNGRCFRVSGVASGYLISTWDTFWWHSRYSLWKDACMWMLI